MSSIIQAPMSFAVSPYGRIVHIDDVPNGVECSCTCPQCDGNLIAKNGGLERAHHFAHESGKECQGATETALHLAAKQVIIEDKMVSLPELSDGLAKPASIIEFTNVYSEYALFLGTGQQRIVVDCYGAGSSGNLIIEIAVHHKVDIFKSDKLQRLGIVAIEIDLSDQIGKLVEWSDLKDLVVFDSKRRRWIQPPDNGDVKNVAQMLKLEKVQKANAHCKEWRFAVGPTWIWVKELPYGNVKVFHRYDEQARLVVEPICRPLDGRWNPKYNNWIVPEAYKNELLKLLGERARRISVPRC